MPTAPRTFCEAFQWTAARQAGQVALRTVGDTTTLLWSEYADRVRALAEGLTALGVRGGDTVALMLRNRPEFHVADTAVLHLGAIPFSVYNTSSPQQVAHLLTDSRARLVITEECFLPVLDQPARAVDATVVTVDGAFPGTLSLDDVSARTVPGFDFEAIWRSVGPDDVLTLIYTSGTTGQPKGVEITHRAELALCAASNERLGINPFDRMISFLPSAHMADRWSSHYTQMTAGTELTTVDKPRDIAAALADVHPQVFGAVPQIWQRLHNNLCAALEQAADSEPDEVRRLALSEAPGLGLRCAEAAEHGRLTAELADRWAELDSEVLAPLRKRFGLDRLRVAASGAAPIEPSLLLNLRGLGIPVSSGLGMSELSGMVTYSPPGEAPVASVGHLLPGVEASIAADGELLIRGEIVMRGYRGAPEKTAAAFTAEGWLRTGDVATIDPSGAITVVDRKKDLMISTGGKNLSPSAIEGAVLSHTPLLAHAVVIGDARPFVTALLVPDPDAVTAFAVRHGLDGGPAELCRHPVVRAAIETGLAAANSVLSRPEQVRAHTVLAEDWHPGSEFVTHTRKTRRRPIHEHYAAQIEAMYAEHAAVAGTA
ncbi:AMP-dependent synthetase/ligase [Streptomyces hokutonensis]|uniref:AMP-dependent synthetase/ligase n=1 Tax=Streptomyces hokutonensis TaxID=1306990 RepID=UPI00036BE33F|nr:AMP-dependent synthetase/ligase [Streptomyces hokutonensis]